MTFSSLKKNLLLVFPFLFLNACKSRVSVEKGQLTSFINVSISSLDPIHSTMFPVSPVISGIFEGLYHYHYFKRPLKIEANLAKAMPQVSENKRVYTIKIKKGVYFQNDPAFPNSKGRELVARDFVYSWKRLADPENKAKGWWVFDGLIKGLNEWRQKAGKSTADYDKPVEGLKALDSHTLRITLTRPSSQFLHFLCMPVTMVVAREVVDYYGHGIGSHPVGTGPYQVEKWVRNSEIILKKNRNFRKVFFQKEDWPKERSKGKQLSEVPTLPLTKRVVIKIIKENQSLWLLFLKGKLDHGLIPLDHYSVVLKGRGLAQKYKKKGIRLLRKDPTDVTFLVFNMKDPLLGKNKFLRKALASAIDKKLLFKKFYHPFGEIAQGLVPRFFPSYDSNYKNPLTYDLKKARAFLKKAGYPEGQGLPVFEYDTNSNHQWSGRFAEFIKDQLAQIGVKVKIKSNSWPLFNEKINRGKAKIFDMAWVADYPDSENFFQIFYSKNISPGPNSSNFVHRGYDSLFEKALLLPPGPEQNKIFRQMLDLINEEVPVVLLIHRIKQSLYYSWLDNFNIHPMIFDYYQYLSVDEKEKKAYLQANDF